MNRLANLISRPEVDGWQALRSCKGRVVCPSCNTRRIVEAAAQLTDHVFSRLPVFAIIDADHKHILVVVHEAALRVIDGGEGFFSAIFLQVIDGAIKQFGGTFGLRALNSTELLRRSLFGGTDHRDAINADARVRVRRLILIA